MRHRFRCAHVPLVNGIVERYYRTVKVIAARTGCSVAEAVYLHNLRPRDDHDSSIAPSNVMYRYSVRVRGVDPCEEEEWKGKAPIRVEMQYGSSSLVLVATLSTKETRLQKSCPSKVSMSMMSPVISETFTAALNENLTE